MIFKWGRNKKAKTFRATTHGFSFLCKATRSGYIGRIFTKYLSQTGGTHPARVALEKCNTFGPFPDSRSCRIAMETYYLLLLKGEHE